MLERWRNKKKLVVSAALVAMASTAAWAFPWDIDMVDSLAYKAYEWKMMPLPEGAQSVNWFRGGYSKMTRMMPEAEAIASPITVDDQVLIKGERLFAIYCQTCHGVKGQ